VLYKAKAAAPKARTAPKTSDTDPRLAAPVNWDFDGPVGEVDATAAADEAAGTGWTTATDVTATGLETPV